MEALADINEDTDDLVDDVQEDLKSDLQRNVKRTVAIVLAVVAVLIALFSIATCAEKSEERQSLRDFQAREDFRTNYFEEFDRLYEAGDDDALSAYVWSLTNDPGFDALFSWKHVDFLEVHDGWEALRSTKDNIEEGSFTLEDYAWSVSLALRMAQLVDDGDTVSATLSKEEEQRASNYRAYAAHYLENVLQMSKKEVAAFADEVKDEQGFIQKDKLERNLEVRLKQLGALH